MRRKRTLDEEIDHNWKMMLWGIYAVIVCLSVALICQLAVLVYRITA